MDLLINFKNKKNDFFKKENIFYLMIILIIFFLDRYSKIMIIKNFNEKKFFLNNYLNIDLLWNTGIGFGLLAFNSTIIYNAISFLICFIILGMIYVMISLKNLDKLILSLIIGGAFGNLYDRLNYNAVPDFIDLHYNNFHWFTFNLADVFITLGVAAYIVRGFFEKH